MLCLLQVSNMCAVMLMGGLRIDYCDSCQSDAHPPLSFSAMPIQSCCCSWLVTHAHAHMHAHTTQTEMCVSWLNGATCRYGGRCQFAHGLNELRQPVRPAKYKTQVCVYVCMCILVLPDSCTMMWGRSCALMLVLLQCSCFQLNLLLNCDSKVAKN
jgi:Zinc finger C-x8-C-x5-C-x3-H type (and similar)